MSRKGFTLIEVIIVISIFSIVSLVGVDAYLNGFQNEQKTQLQNKAMQDAKYIMNSLVAEISSKEIDYEEYFSQCVMQGACPNSDLSVVANRPNEVPYYGINHGYYNWQFYFGGYQDLAQTKEDGYGTRCQTAGGTAKYPNADCITGPLPFSEDSNTGVNLKTNSLEADAINAEAIKASAICAPNFQLFADNNLGIVREISKNTCNQETGRLFNELYLIDPASKLKTVIGRGKLGSNSDSFAISKMELEQENLDTNDVTLPISGYKCSSKYICTEVNNEIESTTETGFNTANLKTPARYSLYDGNDSIYLDFIPISPLSVNVKKLQFLINPLEDPVKAYREKSLMHPTVTIILELEPSNKYKLPFFSTGFNLKLQSTVSTVLNTN